jgi:tRNA(Ile)-lysidine synthase
MRGKRGCADSVRTATASVLCALRATLEAHTPAAATGFVVGLSGGADSAALLAAMVALRATPLRALHVDHGLQAAAAEFREACGEMCLRLGVPLSIIPVVVSTPAGESVEAAARDARYAALAQELRPGECLLTAHHREDQAETLLLQALRGAGIAGLSAMPPCRSLGKGWHLRPLLDVAQQELLAPAACAGVVEAAAAGAGATTAVNAPASSADPMNADLRFDRVYVRRRVWPQIETRWPGAAAALSRTARHVAEARELLERTAAADLGRLRDGEALSLPRLRALAAAQRINAVRHWISERGRLPPPAARLNEALRQLFDADADHLPAVVWGDCALRRYRDRVFLTEAHPPRLQGARRWEAALGASVDLGPGLGSLRWVAAPVGGVDLSRLPRILSVRARSGGETLRPAAHARTQSVQHLCQSQGVLPWLRDALPLVFADDGLIAVADLWFDSKWVDSKWMDANACAAPSPPGCAIVWEHAPLIS